MTMSPREKVEPSLDDLLRQAVETMKSWTPEQREAHFEAQKKAWVAAEIAFGDEGTRVVTSPTAVLASSGEHADHSGGVTDMVDHVALARRLDVLRADHLRLATWNKGKDRPARVAFHHDAVIDIDRCVALLAEIAALRAKSDPSNWKDREDQWSKAVEEAHPVNSIDPDRHKHFDTAMSMVGNRHGKYELVGLVHWLLTRATEAERKLAEAVGHLTAMTHVAPRAHEVTEALAFISSLEDHR